ncbi:MAG: class I SAM-dependent methyltransferase [archaeon]|nr:class I SAM-dependent methyltransferase [archaeon]
MEIEDQENLWDKIAPEWHKYKEKPSENAVLFLKKADGNVLDLGSGSGRHLMKIKDGKMFLLDFSEKMLNLARQKAKTEGIPAEFIHSPLGKIEKPDEFFDYAICISALHCVSGKTKRKKVIEELFRVLKKDGIAYIGVWNKDSKRFKRAGKEKLVGWGELGKRYYYLFNEKEIHDLFKAVGFDIVSTHNSEMMINFVVKKR